MPLVREALHERATLLKIAPHLVWPLAFVLPIYDTTRRPIGVPVSLPRGIGVGLAMEIGLTAYDVLAGKQNIARHRHIPADEAVRDVPGLRTDGLKSAFVYSDAGTNDTQTRRHDHPHGGRAGRAGGELHRGDGVRAGAWPDRGRRGAGHDHRRDVHDRRAARRQRDGRLGGEGRIARHAATRRCRCSRRRASTSSWTPRRSA